MGRVATYPAPWERGRGQLPGQDIPYEWNENGVCTNPQVVGYFRARPNTYSDCYIKLAQDTQGKWHGGYTYDNDDGNGGASSPVILSSKGHDTRYDAVLYQCQLLTQWNTRPDGTIRNRSVAEICRRAIDEVQPTLFEL